MTTRKGLSLRNTSLKPLKRVQGSTAQPSVGAGDDSPADDYMLKYAMPLTNQEKQVLMNKAAEKRASDDIQIFPLLQQLQEIHHVRRQSLQNLQKLEKTSVEAESLQQRKRYSYDLDIQLQNNLKPYKLSPITQIESQPKSNPLKQSISYLKSGDEKFTFYQTPFVTNKRSSFQNDEATSPSVQNRNSSKNSKFNQFSEGSLGSLTPKICFTPYQMTPTLESQTVKWSREQSTMMEGNSEKGANPNRRSIQSRVICPITTQIGLGLFKNSSNRGEGNKPENPLE